MLLVRFGPGEDSFYINNGTLSYWSNIPYGLAKTLQTDLRFTPDRIIDVAIFPNKGYFVVAQDDKWFHSGLPEGLSSLMESAGVRPKHIKGIDHDSANPSCYVLYLKNESIVHQGVPQDLLETAFTQTMRRGFTAIAVGNNGSWAFACQDERIFMHVNDAPVRQMLSLCEGFTALNLSPYNEEHALCEDRARLANDTLPLEWRSYYTTLFKAKERIRHVDPTSPGATKPPTILGDHRKGFAASDWKGVPKSVLEQVLNEFFPDGDLTARNSPREKTEQDAFFTPDNDLTPRQSPREEKEPYPIVFSH